MKKHTRIKVNRAIRASSNIKAKRKWIGISILAVLIVTQLLFDAVVVWRHVTSIPQSEPVVATTIFHTIDSFYTPVPVEAKTNNYYVASARLLIPASDINDMLYAYTPADGDTLASISFTTRQMINYGESQTVSAYYDSYAKDAFSLDREHGAFEALFAELPSLQACSRGVQIFEVAQAKDRSLVDRGEKQLQDARILHFYTEEQCKQQDKLDDLLNVIKRIESF